MTLGSKVKVFRIGPTTRTPVFFDRGSMNTNDLYILSDWLASSATPLTFSMEDIHICNSVCLGYVDDKKLCVLVKCQIFKTQKYFKRLYQAILTLHLNQHIISNYCAKYKHTLLIHERGVCIMSTVTDFKNILL